MTKTNQKKVGKTNKDNNLSFLLEVCGEITKCDNCGVYLLDQKKNTYSPLLVLKTSKILTHNIKSLWENDALLQKLNNEKSIVMEKDDTAYVAPLFMGNELFGFFASYYTSKTLDDATQKKLSLFSHQIKAYLENQKLSDCLICKENTRDTWQKELFPLKKMASVGELTRDFAHDINNPLQIVLGKAQILSMRMKKEGIDKKYIEELESIERNAQRISCLVKKLQDFAKRGEDDTVSSSDVNLNHLLERTFLLVKNRYKSKGIDFQIKSQKNVPAVKGNPYLLEQVFLDLFLNAQRSMPQGGSLTVDLKKEKDFLKLDFVDTGEKISEKLLSKVFDPQHLTPELKKRLPSGFILSHQIVRDHKGEMEVLSNMDKGNIFRLKLPVIK